MRAFAASFSLLALVVAALLAGQRYFYCPTMEQSAFTACCIGHGAEIDVDLQGQTAIDAHIECCEARDIEANAPHALQQPPPQLLSPLLAILPPLFAHPELALVEPPRLSMAEIRAGPTPREARAALQVYLC